MPLGLLSDDGADFRYHRKKGAAQNRAIYPEETMALWSRHGYTNARSPSGATAFDGISIPRETNFSPSKAVPTHVASVK